MPALDSANAFLASVAWIAQLLTGQLANALAIVAFAGLGYAMLHGRIAAREAIRVLIGAVILFGAPTIATALAKLGTETRTPPSTIEVPAPPPVVAIPPAPANRANNDPYAGASLPME